MKNYWWIVFLFVIRPVCAELAEFDEAPWFSCAYKFYPRLIYQQQHYHAVDRDTYGRQDFRGHDRFLTAALKVTPIECWNVQLAAVAAQTSFQNQPYMHSCRALFRHHLSDDVIGDPVSAVMGFKLIQASKAATRDIGTFIHGRWSNEAHLTIGKEWAPHASWIFRGWGLAALGVGSQGAPWVRAKGCLEFQDDRLGRHSASIESRWGLGCRSLSLCDFQGYQSLNYRTVDLGWRIEYFFLDLRLQAAIKYRVFARNAPTHSTELFLSVITPFSF